MQVLLVSATGKVSVSQAPNPTRAIFDASQAQVAAGKLASKYTAYPDYVKATSVFFQKGDMQSERVTYTACFFNRIIDIEFINVMGMLFNPYAELEDGIPVLQLIARDGQLTPYAEHFLK